MSPSATTPKRVLIVGAGSSGLSTAHHLSLSHPLLPLPPHITVIDSIPRPGGQAFSVPLSPELGAGAEWLNQGVQGGSGAFHHTLGLFKRYGFSASPVELQVSFGKGPSAFWTNLFPTPLLSAHAREIARFSLVLPLFAPLLALLPIRLFLALFCFSRAFVDRLVLPTLALFLGTGNATPQVPTIIMHQLFRSPHVGMWFPGPSPARLVDTLPPMVVFPNLGEFYAKWTADLRARGVEIRLGTELVRVVSRSRAGGVVVALRTDGHEVIETYDELVLACLADTSLNLLGDQATWLERFVLGSAKFSDDVTVTHTDAGYMERFYTCRDAEHPEFRPMYFIRSYDADTKKIEMGFDCTNYQAQFPRDEEEVPLEKHVFQTIFLNKDRDGHLWDKGEIDEAKIVREDWWHQLCHSYTHYLLVTPLLWLIQASGTRRTHYAGSWTVVNAHEVGVLSGAAAAYRIGGGYPYVLDGGGAGVVGGGEEGEEGREGWDRASGWMVSCFWAYLLLVHGVWFRVPKGANGRG